MATDNFNRANGGLGSNWGEIDTAGGWGPLAISSNQVAGSGAGNNWAASRWTADSIDADQYSQVVLAGLGFFGSDVVIGPICRASADQDSARDFYFARVEDDGSTDRTVRVGRVVNGTVTSMGTSTQTVGNGAVLRLEVEGTSLRVYINGGHISALDVTDSNIASGQPGIACAVDGGLDDWEGGALTAPTAAVTGTATASIDEDDIVAGGKTVIVTLTGATFVPATTDLATGDTFPGSGTTQDRSGATAWTNPGFITADDSSFTTAAVPTDYLIASNFGFAIPSSATILGVTVKVNASETGTGSSNYVPQLISDATPTLIGSPKSAVTVTGTTKVTSTNGGAADLWGATLTPAIVNSSGFGAAIWSTDTVNTLSVDFITIDVAYRVPTFDDARQAMIDGMDSAQSEANGWDAEVKANQGVSGVVRTSDTVVTVTLDAQAAYDISAQETIEVTVPSAILASGGPIVATPTFTIDTAGGESAPVPPILVMAPPSPSGWRH